MTATSDNSTIESQQPNKSVRSRRALLTGAVGGLAAAAASMLARPANALGADGKYVKLGEENFATEATRLENTTDDVNALAFGARSNSGVAIRGRSVTGQGVQGFSASSAGVQGFSETDAGVNGFGYFGVWASGNPYGIFGVGGETGVYGVSEGGSPSRGIFGESQSGYAGYFAGKVYTTHYYELEEISAPDAPSANGARLFVRDNGAGKTQLCVRFNSGPIRVVATQA